MTCELNNLLGRYHDGELSPTQRSGFETHLADCPACAAELEQLDAMTRVLRSAKMPRASAPFRARLEALSGRVEDTRILRFAMRLTAAAAALLVVATGYRTLHHRPAPAQPVAHVGGLSPQEQVVVDPSSALAIATTDEGSAEPRLDELIIGDLSKGRP